MCVSERERKRERDRPKCPMSESWIPFFLKSVLIFHHWGFYGTDSIPEESGGQSYFSSKKKIFVNVQREGVGRRGRCGARAGVCHLHLRKWEEEKKKKNQMKNATFGGFFVVVELCTGCTSAYVVAQEVPRLTDVCFSPPWRHDFFFFGN